MTKYVTVKDELHPFPSVHIDTPFLLVITCILSLSIFVKESMPDTGSTKTKIKENVILKTIFKKISPRQTSKIWWHIHGLYKLLPVWAYLAGSATTEQTGSEVLWVRSSPSSQGKWNSYWMAVALKNNPTQTYQWVRRLTVSDKYSIKDKEQMSNPYFTRQYYAVL